MAKQHSNGEVLLHLRGDYETGEDADSLVCAIFTIECDVNNETFSYTLVRGRQGPKMQMDYIFKYYDNHGNIAVGDSTGDQWNSAWTWTNDNDEETFSEEIDEPDWEAIDSEMLEKLNALVREYIDWIEDEDGEEYCIARPGSYKNLEVYEENPGVGKIIFSTNGADDEKLSDFSDIWSLQVSYK